MDDILSSIRKIIEEDGARVMPAGEPTTTAGPQLGKIGPTSGPGVTTGAPVRPDRTSGTDDDVLLLTELVDEPDEDAARAPAPAQPSFAAPPTPEIKPTPSVTLSPVMTAASAPTVAEVSPEPRAPVQAAAPERVVSPVSPASMAPAREPDAPPRPPEDPILSAMDRLARAVESAQPPVTAPEPRPVVNGSRSLEDLVRDMLQPMLQEWIDRNLPQVVEQIVEREVKRLTRTRT